jgi:hypothetical protein
MTPKKRPMIPDKRQGLRSNVTTREAVETAIELSKLDRFTWDEAPRERPEVASGLLGRKALRTRF